MPKKRDHPVDPAYLRRITEDLFKPPAAEPAGAAPQPPRPSIIEQLNAPLPAPNTDPESLARWAEIDRILADPQARAAFAAVPGAVGPQTSEERMVEWYLRDHPHTICRQGQVLRCTGGLWQVVPPASFNDEVQQLIDTARLKGEIHYRTAQRLPRPFAARLLARLSRLAASFGPPPSDALPCANGLLDLTTGQLRPFAPDDHILAALPYAFKPGARSTVWENFLQSTVPGCAAFLQEFAGLALTADTRYETALWLYGPPGAGKSTFLHALHVLLGDLCGTLDLAELLAGRFHPDRLAGKNLLTCAEPLAASLDQTARFNALVSGDEFTLQPRYRPAQVVQSGAKLAWAFTTLPRVPNPDSPLFRRVRIVPFPAVPEAMQDPSLKARLAAEGPALLNWALAGLQRLSARGRFDLPPAIVAATAAFRHDNDLPAQFIEDRYVRDPAGRVQAGPFYLDYKKWCQACGYPPADAKAAARHWVRLGFERRLSEGRYYWHGLRSSFSPPKPGSLLNSLIEQIRKS
jgi:P4 family phage/plasmid primase-like protien